MSHVSMKAARRATRTIPIVMVALNYDPIALGYVQSLARPGGNITGLVYRGVDTAPKQLELLREALPAGATVAVLWDAQAAADQVRVLEAASTSLGVKLHKVEVGPPYDFDAAFAAEHEVGRQASCSSARPGSSVSARGLRTSRLSIGCLRSLQPTPTCAPPSGTDRTCLTRFVVPRTTRTRF
jgi:hypothetical protein